MRECAPVGQVEPQVDIEVLVDDLACDRRAELGFERALGQRAPLVDVLVQVQQLVGQLVRDARRHEVVDTWIVSTSPRRVGKPWIWLPSSTTA